MSTTILHIPVNTASAATSMSTSPRPRGFPPRSPSSTAINFFQPSSKQSSKRQRKKRGSKRSTKPEKSNKSEPLKELNIESSSSNSINSEEDTQTKGKYYSDGEIERYRALRDPTPQHLRVAEDSSDFCSTADLNTVSFDAASPNVTVQPLRAFDLNKPLHKTSKLRRVKSWDAGDATNLPSSSSKVFFPVPSIFRRQKVRCADVASLSNASDTVVADSENGGRISGRELHETAKEVLNSGDYKQAVKMFEALHKAQMDRFGEMHSSVGAATHNVGVVRLRMGQARRAERTLEQAVRIRRKVLGDHHLDVAASLSKLGSSRILLRRFDAGLEVLREALCITRATLGRSHRAVAQILCHIACLYFEAGELYSSLATFDDALGIFREVFASETDRDACMSQLTETLCNIGSIQNKRKQFADASASFQEALDLQRGILGHDHPRIIASLDNLGYSFSKRKMYSDALKCYKKMLTAQISHHGSVTLECCETLKKQVLMYEKSFDLSGAVKATKKALARIQKDCLIPEDSVAYEVEQLLTELKHKQQLQRRGEF